MADPTSRAGTTYVSQEIIAWTNRVHASHDPSLQAAFDTPAMTGIPAIMVGESEGKLLSMLVAMIRAKKVVEIGTLAGYSAIQLARGVGLGGRVWSIENDPKHAELARENVRTAGLGAIITVEVGAGLEVLPRLQAHGPFDAVFIDADKANYDEYGRWAAANVRPGGLLLGDNAFLFGKLLEDSPTAAAMRRFHEEARAAFETVCIPTPDGLLLGVRR
ncbi:MAG: O-methyltransferase [Deltaproteobacteria bacterium]|nr:O-methyltransferase [Deltaproteobacteria bacterium]